MLLLSKMYDHYMYIKPNIHFSHLFRIEYHISNNEKKLKDHF